MVALAVAVKSLSLPVLAHLPPRVEVAAPLPPVLPVVALAVSVQVPLLVLGKEAPEVPAVAVPQKLTAAVRAPLPPEVQKAPAAAKVESVPPVPAMDPADPAKE